jgi:hypothetical protein
MTKDRSGAWWLADFVMCWLALCGLVNAAIGMGSFVYNIQIADVSTPIQRSAYIAMYLGLSTIGFFYMLWRYNWSCRLSTLVSVTALWCVALAMTPYLQGEPKTLSLCAFLGVVFFLFFYALNWACHCKTRPDRKK